MCAFAERNRRFLQAKLADEHDMIEEHSGKLACARGAQYLRKGAVCGAGAVESGGAAKAGEVLDSEQFSNPVHGQDEDGEA